VRNFITSGGALRTGAATIEARAEQKATILSAYFDSNLVRHKQSQFWAAFGKLETLMAPGVRIRSSPAGSL
jgi:hypothetical protein